MRYENLSSLIVKELTTIPRCFWGGFFPIHVAVWRLLRRRFERDLDDVYVIKDSDLPPIPSRILIDGDEYKIARYPSGTPADWEPGGYGLKGQGTMELNYILWELEDVISPIEKLAYFLSDNTPSVSDSLDCVDERHLPKMDEFKMNLLEAVCIEEYKSALRQTRRQ